MLADVAVKITPTSVVRSACKEVMALTRLNNAHIVQLLGVQVDMAEEKVYMVMEYAALKWCEPHPQTRARAHTPGGCHRAVTGCAMAASCSIESPSAAGSPRTMPSATSSRYCTLSRTATRTVSTIVISSQRTFC